MGPTIMALPGYCIMSNHKRCDRMSLRVMYWELGSKQEMEFMDMYNKEVPGDTRVAKDGVLEVTKAGTLSRY